MTEVIETTTFSAGQTVNSDPINITGASQVGLYLNGDTDSTDVTIKLEVRQSSTKDWHEVDNETVSNDNLTNAVNDAKAYDYDVSGFNKQVRFKVTNNSASSTDLTANAEKSQNR